MEVPPSKGAIAGFPCKDASVLNTKWEELQTNVKLQTGKTGKPLAGILKYSGQTCKGLRKFLLLGNVAGLMGRGKVANPKVSVRAKLVKNKPAASSAKEARGPPGSSGLDHVLAAVSDADMFGMALLLNALGFGTRHDRSRLWMPCLDRTFMKEIVAKKLHRSIRARNIK